MLPKFKQAAKLAGFALAAATAIGLSTGASQALDKTQLQVVGTWSSLSQWKNFENAFWNETLPGASNGDLTANARPMDELGLTGFELMRQLKLGVFDVIHTLAVYSASDIPMAAGIDLGGLIRSREDYQKMITAYRPVLEKEFAEDFNAKILAMYSFSSYTMLCNLPDGASRDGLNSISGLKVRVHSKPMGDFIEGLGGTPVTLPFGEVVPALQQGVVDCGVTGILSAYQAKWHQVTNSFVDVPLGYGTVVVAVNLDTWNGLSAETQQFIESQLAKFEEAVTAGSVKEDETGFACYGSGPCSAGDAAGHAPISIPAASMDTVDGVVSDFVLARFAERCGSDCTKIWNDSVGTALGVTAGH